MPGHTYATYALRRKRAALATLDSVINMFEPECHPDMIPAIRPYLRDLFSGYQELSRLTLSALRAAGKPATPRWITEWIIAEKGLDDVDARLRRHFEQCARATARLSGAGRRSGRNRLLCRHSVH